jgi:hypothetical protein
MRFFCVKLRIKFAFHHRDPYGSGVKCPWIFYYRTYACNSFLLPKAGPLVMASITPASSYCCSEKIRRTSDNQLPHNNFYSFLWYCILIKWTSDSFTMHFHLWIQSTKGMQYPKLLVNRLVSTWGERVGLCERLSKFHLSEFKFNMILHFVVKFIGGIVN